MSIAVVIRAGGAGTRLWPVSTSENPKQFLPILSDRTLLQETWERVSVLGAENIFVTANVRHADLVRAQLPELLPTHLLLEPAGRNTGPAMALETAALGKILPANTLVVSIPADDYVATPAAFLQAVELAGAYLTEHPEQIILPVVTPQQPDPGFSYLRAAVQENGQITPITDWVEKPDLSTCEKMLATRQWFSHAGMYFWLLSTAAYAFKNLAPEVWHVVHDVLLAQQSGQTEEASRLMNEMPFVSIETLITKAHPHKAALLADDWGWSDVGKWTVVKQLLFADTAGNVLVGSGAHFSDAANNLVYSVGDKKVVCVGVRDLLVIEGEKYLLICPAAAAHEIGAISKKISAL